MRSVFRYAEEVVWPLERCFWEAAEYWDWKGVVSVDMVRRANLGEKKKMRFLGDAAALRGRGVEIKTKERKQRDSRELES